MGKRIINKFISITLSVVMVFTMMVGAIATEVYAAGEDFVFTITDSNNMRIDNNTSNAMGTMATATAAPGDTVYFVINAPGYVEGITGVSLSMCRPSSATPWAGDPIRETVANMVWTYTDGEAYADDTELYYDYYYLTQRGSATMNTSTGPVPMMKFAVTIPQNAQSGTTFSMILGKGTALSINNVTVINAKNGRYKDNNVSVFQITVRGEDQFNDPVYTWAPDNSSVTATKECTTDPTKTVTETVNTTSTVTQQPTCTAKGKTKYTATFTKPEFTTQTKTVSNINALGHDLQKTNAVAATCTVAGNSEYWTCQRSNCGKMFSDANGNTEITAVPTIPATGHAYGSWTSISATQHKHVCGNDPSHEEVENHTWNNGVVTTAATEEAPGVKTYTCTKCSETKTEEIPQQAHTHDMQEIPAKAATCTEAGNNKYYKCTKCNKYYKDSNGNTETTVAAETIAALGHSPQKTNAVPATCTTAGNNAYWTCQRSGCGKVFSDSACTAETTVAQMTIPATGHAYGSWTSISATQHKHVCGNDPSHEEVENHTWNNGVVTTAATEEAPGVKTYTCTKCGETKTEEIPQQAHTHDMQEIPAKAATCTEAGNNKYYKCTRCNKYYKDENGKDETTVSAEKIAALGHSWGSWTKKDDDQHERVCSHDASHKETENHTWNNGVVTTDATEEAPGVKTYTCTKCGAEKTEEIPKLVVKYTVIFKDGSKELKRVPNLTKGATVDDYTPKKTDYVFDKWTPDFKATVDPADFDSNRELIYTAEWKEDKNNNGTPDDKETADRWTVTYTDGVGGSVFADRVFNDVINGAYVPSFGNNPKRSGYIFVDWDRDVPEKVTENLTFNATWVEENGDQILVTFETDSQGTISGKAYELIKKGEFVTAPPEAVPVDGKIWVGWESSEGGVYDNVALKKLPITGHTTFTAKYADSGKAVAVFNYAGGKDASGKSSTTLIGDPGASYTVPDYTKITRTGYTATGWTPAGAGKFGEANKSVTYTLGWKANETTPPTETTPTTPADPSTDPNKNGEDGTPIGKGASAAAAEKAITSMKNDNDPKGSVFNLLQLQSKKQDAKSVTISWKKVEGANEYVIYGNACGAKNKMKKLATVKTNKQVFKKILNKKVKKGTYYKFIVVALDKDNMVVTTSKVVHAATKGGKVGNDKSVTIKAKVNKNGKKIASYKKLSKTVIKKGKRVTIKGIATPQSKKLKVKRHRPVVFESSNPEIATVNKKGVIKAKNNGTCYIYAYAQVGVWKRIKITVK